MIPRLLEKYRSEIISSMMKKFGYRNVFQVPMLKKIVINMGVGAGSQDIRILETASMELAQICGQRPVLTRAKKSIANFKIKEGSPVGCKVTLRGPRMYEFLDRLINVALPRIRDFKGISSNSFDQHGNFSLGISEQVIFPEIDYDKVHKIQGMDVVICTNANSRDESYELLQLFGLPFRTI